MSSLDKRISTKIIQTLEDGQKGFAEAAEKVDGTDYPDLLAKFNSYSAQRATFSTELETLAAAYGDDIDESGSVLAAAHRSWMTVKDMLAGSSPEGVIEAALQGESYTISQYQEALEEDISRGLREVLVRQMAEIQKVDRELASVPVPA